jgi:hypothetical protein
MLELASRTGLNQLSPIAINTVSGCLPEMLSSQAGSANLAESGFFMPSYTFVPIFLCAMLLCTFSLSSF